MKVQKDQGAPQAQTVGIRRSKRLIALLLAAALLVGGATGYMYYIRQTPAAESQQQTAPVTRQNLTRLLTGTGTLAPIEQFKITPLVTGKVLECTFEEGDKVEQGQLLYRIDPSEAQKNIEQAKLALRQSQLAAGQQAEELEKLTIRAEQSGTVTELFVKVGDIVEAGTKLATIRDSATMLLTLPFNASDTISFAPGQSAIVTVGGSFDTLSGRIKEIEAAETVGDGFQVTRNVTIAVSNPGALSPSAVGTAVVAGIASNKGANFTYNTETAIIASTRGKLERLTLTKGGSLIKGKEVARLSSAALKNQEASNAISIEQAQVNLTNAETGIGNYRITAPISGTVVTREVKAGDSLGNGSGTNSMAVIYDLSALVFAIPLDELDVSKVSVGQSVEVRVDALEGRTFKGAVTKISMAGNTEKGKTAYPVTVKIDNPPKELLPGMNVNASIVIAKTEQALTVPVTAVQFGDVVFVRNKTDQPKDNTQNQDAPEGYHTVKVETGISDGTNVEIKSGLKEDDQVLIPAEPPSSTENIGFGEGEGEDSGMMLG